MFHKTMKINAHNDIQTTVSINFLFINITKMILLKKCPILLLSIIIQLAGQYDYSYPDTQNHNKVSLLHINANEPKNELPDKFRPHIKKMSLNCKMIISLIDWLKIFMSAILGGFWPYKTVSIYPRNDIKQTKSILIKKCFVKDVSFASLRRIF